MAPKWSLLPGDCRESLKLLKDRGIFVDSVVTDPPYHLTSIVKRFGGKNAAAKYGTDGAFSRASVGFMGQCFHPATEILTNTGWKFVSAVGVMDSVMTLNPGTRDAEWQRVAQVHRYPFSGTLVQVRHRSAEQIVTPNHKVLISRDGGKTLQLPMAKDLPQNFHLFAQGNPIAGVMDESLIIESTRDYGKDRLEQRVERKTFKTKEFFRFLGLWLGDGYVVSRTGSHPANDFFGLSVKKERKKTVIRETLQNLGIKFTETLSDKGYSHFYCYDFAILGWLKNLGGAKQKHIPNTFFNWDCSVLEELYQGLMETDGCRQGKKGQEVFFTSSSRLADDFQRLCLHTGRSASIKLTTRPATVIEGRALKAADIWTCCVLPAGKRMYGEKSNRGSNVVYDFPYTGEVVCVGVPKHHIVYVRMNGKPIWSGNSWDGGDIAHDPEFWAMVLDVMKPGAYVAAFSSTRTGHRQACAMEDAGFVMHPMLGWAFGSGFPKAHNAAKAIDKQLGVEESTEAEQWLGWAYGGQSLKPAFEPIYLAQKPFSEKNGALNILKHGVGAVNLDGCRVGGDGGRHPANLLHDGSEEVVGMFPQSKGQLGKSSDSSRSKVNTYGVPSDNGKVYEPRNDEGSASRFFSCFPPESDPLFYAPKASKTDRAGSRHPTVKPQSLMQWLCRLITPPGGLILDPFAGSGSTGQAAVTQGFRSIMMEQDETFLQDIRNRMNGIKP